jgi:hypothetical protein
MIWDVKIYLAKIKDCKGKDFKLAAKKKLPTKIPPNCREKTFGAISRQNNFPSKTNGLEKAID